MKCCECNKEVNMAVHDIPPKWYGKYEGQKPISVICSDCIKEPEKLERWRKN